MSHVTTMTNSIILSSTLTAEFQTPNEPKAPPTTMVKTNSDSSVFSSPYSTQFKEIKTTTIPSPETKLTTTNNQPELKNDAETKHVADTSSVLPTKSELTHQTNFAATNSNTKSVSVKETSYLNSSLSTVLSGGEQDSNIKSTHEHGGERDPPKQIDPKVSYRNNITTTASDKEPENKNDTVNSKSVVPSISITTRIHHKFESGPNTHNNLLNSSNGLHKNSGKNQNSTPTSTLLITPNTKAIVEKKLWVSILVTFLLIVITLAVLIFIMRRQLLGKFMNSGANPNQGKGSTNRALMKTKNSHSQTNKMMDGVPRTTILNLSTYEFYFCYDEPYVEFKEYLFRNNENLHLLNESSFPHQASKKSDQKFGTKSPPIKVQRGSGVKYKLFEDVTLPKTSSDLSKSDGEKIVEPMKQGKKSPSSPGSNSDEVDDKDENNEEDQEYAGEISPLIGEGKKTPPTPEPSKGSAKK